MRKAEALRYKDRLIYTEHYNNYKTTKDHSSLLSLIQKTTNPNFFEYVPGDKPVPLFLDIDLKDKSLEEGNDIVLDIIKKIKTDLLNYECLVIKQDSHVITNNIVKKFSCHIIVRAFKEGKEFVFQNVSVLKDYILTLNSDGIDTVVYREKGGLFRTYLSSKAGENRPLVLDNLNSDYFEDLRNNFVTYYKNEYSYFELETQNKSEEVSEIKEQKERTDEDTKNTHIAMLPRHSNGVTNTDLLNNGLYTYVKAFVQEKGRENGYVVDTWYNANARYDDKQCVYYLPASGVCGRKGERHLNNNIFFVLKKDRIIFCCFDQFCENKSIMLPDLIQILFEPEVAKVSILDLFRKRDNSLEMTNITTSCFGYTAPVTDNCSIVEAIEHYADPTGYYLKSKTATKLMEVPNITLYNVLNLQVNNFNELNIIQFDKRSSPRKSIVKCEFSPEFLTTLFDTNQESKKFFIKWYENPNSCYYLVLFLNTIDLITENIKHCGKEMYIYHKNIWTTYDSFYHFLALCRHSLNKLITILQNINISDNLLSGSNNEERETLLLFLDDQIGKLKLLQRPENKTEVMMINYDNDFVNCLDNKLDILPFVNGVFELNTFVFREHRRTDYISTYISYPYDKDACHKDVGLFFQQLMPNENERNYLFWILHTLLNSEIPNDNIYFLLGCSSNGNKALMV